MHILQKTVSSELAKRGLEAARNAGIGPQEFQRLTGISDIEAHTIGGRISGSKFISMLNVVERISNPCNLIAPPANDHWAEPFATTIAIVSNAPNLLTAFEKCITYRALVGQVDGMVFRQAGSDCEFEFLMDGTTRTAISAFTSLNGIVQLTRRYAESNGKIISAPILELTGDKPSGWKYFKYFAEYEVRFGQTRNRLLLTVPWAQQPDPQHNAFLYKLFCNKADSELNQLHQSSSFAFRVETFLTVLLQTQPEEDFGNTALASSCARFALSRSALHRRLQKENTHFQNIVVRVRLAHAKRLLVENTRSLSEIGDLLGFSSPSVFSRFFADHVGVSPSHYRSSTNSYL